MRNKNEAVFGVFKNRSQVENTLAALKSEGFIPSDISVLMPKEENKNADLSWLGTPCGLEVPGACPLLVAGPILSALAENSPETHLGDIGGTLIRFGVPDYEARRYEGYVRDGEFLLSVHVDDDDLKSKAQEILKRLGAEDISATVH